MIEQLSKKNQIKSDIVYKWIASQKATAGPMWLFERSDGRVFQSNRTLYLSVTFTEQHVAIAQLPTMVAVPRAILSSVLSVLSMWIVFNLQGLGSNKYSQALL